MIQATKYSGFLFAIFMAATAFSQQSTVKPAGTSTLKRPATNKSSEDLQTKLDFDLIAISYATESPNDTTSQQRAQVGFKLKKKGEFFSQVDITLGTFSTEKSMYYALPEAYVGYGSQTADVTFGRKKEYLNFTDSFFNLGLFQSHFTNDNIEFIEGGMTGLAGHYRGEVFGVSAGYDPIFIPNQGPQTTVEGGRITSSNRWAPAPPSRFKFGSDYKNINYAIRDYQLTEIISNAGYRASAYLGSNEARPWLRLSYAHKPLNEIVLSRDTFSNISNFEGYVFLSPTVIMHDVTGVDLNFDYENIKVSFSAVSDQPINKTAEDQEFIQTLGPLNVVGGVVSADLSSWTIKKTEIYVGAASITGGEIKDLNRSGQESTFAIATSRSLFKQPLRLGGKGEMFFIYNRPVEADVSYTYDQVLKGSLTSAAIRYAPTKNLGLRFGTDIIGVENELAADEQGNFLDQNKANDRFFGGVSYAF